MQTTTPKDEARQKGLEAVEQLDRYLQREHCKIDQFLEDFYTDLPWDKPGLVEALQAILNDVRFQEINRRFIRSYRTDLELIFIADILHLRSDRGK